MFVLFLFFFLLKGRGIPLSLFGNDPAERSSNYRSRVFEKASRGEIQKSWPWPWQEAFVYCNKRDARARDLQVAVGLLET